MTKISVCMATFNGRDFIEKQICSILDQLNLEDELIIVDDASSDDTISKVQRFADPRIKLLVNSKNIGVNGTFERAMSEARGDFLLLSDQDDIWLPGRLELMVATIQEPGIEFVATNYSLIDRCDKVIGDGLAVRLTSNDDNSEVRNLLQILRGKMNYYGCAMAMTARFRDVALPFPDYLECHDIWFAIIGNVCGNIAHIENNTVAHRIHGKNASIICRPIKKKLLARLGLVSQVLAAWSRRSKFKDSRTQVTH